MYLAQKNLLKTLFSYRRRDRHFTWSYEPREGLAVCWAKEVPSFLSYFMILSIGSGIEPATSPVPYRLSSSCRSQ